MTFEEWWDNYENSDDFKQECAESKREAAELVWNAATAAERQRCREIVDERGRYADIAEMLEQIGE